MEVDALLQAEDDDSEELPTWLPLTTSAISLRIFHLDTHVLYTRAQPQKKKEPQTKKGRSASMPREDRAMREDPKSTTTNSKKQKKAAANVSFPSYPTEVVAGDSEEFELPMEQFRRHIK